MRLPIIAGWLVIILGAASGAEPEPAFRWQRAVNVPAMTATALVAVPLDSHLHHATRDGWPDIRLRTAAGVATAFVIRPSTRLRERTVREFWPAQQTAAKFAADVGLQMELTLGKDEPVPSGLRIVSPLRDFEHQVRVESSTDGQIWQPAGEPALIFDYSRFVDARQDTVPMAAGSHRRFRLTIADVTAEQESQLLELHRRLQGGEEADRTERTTIARRPFRIDRLEFYRDVSRPQSSEPETTEIDVDNLSVKSDGARTVVAFETLREPLSALRLLTTSENFSRVVNVETEVDPGDGRLSWKPLAPGHLTKFAVGTLQRDELTIAVPESRREKLRLVIENADSPPLDISGVTATGPAYELLFLAVPNERYALDYCQPDVEAGRYDTAALEAAIRDRQTDTVATLAPPEINVGAPTERPRAWKFWNNSAVLITGIVLLTFLLGVALLRAGKDLKAADDSPLNPLK